MAILPAQLLRLLRAFGVLAGVLVMVFMVARAVPGDPAVNLLGEQATEQELAALRTRLGLDLPAGQQFRAYLGDVFDGSLGHSFQTNETVVRAIGRVLPFTVELALAGVLVACLIAFPLGILAALRKDTALDNGALVLAMVGIAVPNFWLGPLAIHLVCVRLGWLPDPGAGVLGLPSLILPSLILGTALAGKLTRMIRASLLDVVHAEFVTAARARGLPERRVFLAHVLRNSMIPVVTVLGLQLAALLTGTIVTEKVFARPGLGTLMLDAIQARDYPVVQGCVIVVAAIYVAINWAVDGLYLLLDPRGAADHGATSSGRRV